MSLLLDALKRAEQAKLFKAAQEASAKGAAPSPAPAQPAQPELALVSGRTTAQKKFAPAVLPPAPTAAGSPEPTSQAVEPALADAPGPEEEQAQREAAKNVFAAKRPLQQASRKKILAGIGLLLIAVAIGSVYLWLEMNKPKPVAPRSVPPAIQPIVQVPADALPAAKPGTGQIATAAPAASASGGTPPAVVGKGEAALPERVARIKPSAAQAERDVLIKSLTERVPANDSPVALKLSKAIDPPRVSAELASAYDALKSGDYAGARKLYAGVLQGDALNLDAHLGMATALARGGDAGGAANAFRRALEIDPRNGTALAGLIAVSDQSNPGALEVDLKSLRARNNNSAALAFSLGNLYATQARWTEAQQAYFDALRIEPENADYVYNLAVSLDHLKQPKLALDYYERAIAASGKAGAQFDRAQVSRRVNELKSVN
jgi:tetratricopeptide (TPR) repeat protein